MIDAPISGGVAGAKAGTLAIMVSGNPAKVAELMPVFQLWGNTIVVAGDLPGPAQIMKLANNMLSAVALVATSEAMTMSGKAGIPADAMLQILNNGTGRNFATTHLFPGPPDRHFRLRCNDRNLMKDSTRDRARRRTRRSDVGVSGRTAGPETRRFSGPRAARPFPLVQIIRGGDAQMSD